MLSKDRHMIYIVPNNNDNTDNAEADGSVTSESSEPDQISNRSSLGSASTPKDIAELTNASV